MSYTLLGVCPKSRGYTSPAHQSALAVVLGGGRQELLQVWQASTEYCLTTQTPLTVKDLGGFPSDRVGRFCRFSSRSRWGSGGHSEGYEGTYESPVCFSVNPLALDLHEQCTPTGTPTRHERRRTKRNRSPKYSVGLQVSREQPGTAANIVDLPYKEEVAGSIGHRPL